MQVVDVLGHVVNVVGAKFAFKAGQRDMSSVRLRLVELSSQTVVEPLHDARIRDEGLGGWPPP